MLHVLPATNQPVLNQIRLMQFAKSSCRKETVLYDFATKSVHVTRLTGPRQTCFAARDLSHVFCDSRIHTTCNKRILNVAFQLVRQQCCYMQVKGFCFPFQRCLRFQYTRLDRHSAVTGLFFSVVCVASVSAQFRSKERETIESQRPREK